ncbi:hypothetical protein ACEN2J_19495 [Pseudorhodobacter sp. W20_MBD10_FR17]|uniref:hypothetical protein n=1 Tax=Pseudorhodobacter sp. W20_MBD10_FR17 TaxID=3240266 RepID=UPI003F97EFD4
MRRLLQFRLWLWRFAMLAGGTLLLFFAVMTVAPLAPVGEPVLDSVILRATYWHAYGFALVQILGTVLWVLIAVTAGHWARGIKAFAAALVLFACIVAMMGEYGSLIQHGDLRDTIEVARHKLMVSRGITLTLAVVSLALGWWARPLKQR